MRLVLLAALMPVIVVLGQSHEPHEGNISHIQPKTTGGKTRIPSAQISTGQ